MFLCMAQHIKWSGVLSKVATALSLDTQDIVKSEDEMKQERMMEQKQAQQQQMLDMAGNSKVAGEVAKGQMNKQK